MGTTIVPSFAPLNRAGKWRGKQQAATCVILGFMLRSIFLKEGEWERREYMGRHAYKI